MIQIHFDILWTVIADTLYRRFAQDLPRFERERADTLFRRFINMPGQIVYNKKEFIIKIRKRAHTHRFSWELKNYNRISKSLG